MTVRQPAAPPVSADGFTQASSVMASTRSSDAAGATLTQSVTPLNESAVPNPSLPAERVAPVIVPVLPAADASKTEGPPGSLNPSASTRLAGSRGAIFTFATFDTASLLKFDTHRFDPSNARPNGPPPRSMLSSTAPSAARSFVTLSPPLFATQMLLPSNTTSVAPSPVGNAPSRVPSFASFITVWLKKLATHTLVPSNATPNGPSPTLYVATTRPSDSRSFVTVLL